MSFWASPLGEITGKAEDCFTTTFETIPNNTKTLARIMQFKLKDTEYQIDWEITEGAYKKSHVLQKIRAFDIDEKKRHKALNMLKYLYQLYQLHPSSNEPPEDIDLLPFTGQVAGIRIQEWYLPKEDMEGNFISEVHPATGFVCEEGKKKVNIPQTKTSGNASHEMIDNDVPF